MKQFLSFMSSSVSCGTVEGHGNELEAFKLPMSTGNAASVPVSQREVLPPVITRFSEYQASPAGISDQESGPKTGVPLSSEKAWTCPTCGREYQDEIGEVCTSELCPGSKYFDPSSEKTFCFAGAQSDEDLEALETAIHIECTERWA